MMTRKSEWHVVTLILATIALVSMFAWAGPVVAGVRPSKDLEGDPGDGLEDYGDGFERDDDVLSILRVKLGPSGDSLNKEYDPTWFVFTSLQWNLVSDCGIPVLVSTNDILNRRFDFKLWEAIQ